MALEKVRDYLAGNHAAQMAICCLLPVALIWLLPLAGITGAWLFPVAVVACIGSHLAMSYFWGKEGKKCH
ncbi:hypothetical protein HY995_02415 [Candidatus Micrarchaeota archaeon]|nr:hypothetical protein [Candidatus Micrarchaeota archaeon]